MTPIAAISETLTSMGYAGYIPVLLAVIGLFSAISTRYPATWKGAATIHAMALLFGNAAPATPAASTTSDTK